MESIARTRNSRERSNVGEGLPTHAEVECLRREWRNEMASVEEMTLERCLRYLCDSLGSNVEGKVTFSKLASIQISVRTSHTSPCEPQLIKQLLLDMLVVRKECGAIPLVLKQFPSLHTEEGKEGIIGLWCKFALVEQ